MMRCSEQEENQNSLNLTNVFFNVKFIFIEYRVIIRNENRRNFDDIYIGII